MKAFIVIVILLIIGGVVYLQFVDPDALDKISGDEISKSTNKFGITETNPMGTLEKLDTYLVDRLKLRKDASNPRKIYYINDKFKGNLAKRQRAIVLDLSFTNQITKISAKTVFNDARKGWYGADATFMSEYWTLLTGDEKPDWQGRMAPIVGGSGTDAKAEYSAPGIKATYIWKAPSISYRTLVVEKTDKNITGGKK